jgi:hypothetical protein
MIIRPFSAKDQEWIEGWASKRAVPTLPLEFRPESTFVIADGKDLPKAALALLMTNSPVCYLEDLQADPALLPEHREEALQYLTGFVISWAQAKGAKMVLAQTTSRGGEKWCKEQHFEHLEGAKTYYRRL